MNLNLFSTSITVFTPTYNRAQLLARLYQSLKRQTFKNFEWIIYDDGSTDNTKEKVEGFIEDSSMEIRYYKTNNSGKHIAINKGTDLAKGELFFIVDSDDYLTDNSLQLVVKAWQSIAESEKGNFVGVAGRRLLVNMKSYPFTFRKEYYDADAIKFSLIDRNIQDKAEVYVTKILRDYKFKEFKQENFITEDVIWFKLAQDGYKIRWFNREIYVCEYLRDGLTNNAIEKRIRNIEGTCFSYNELSSYKLPVVYKIRYKINYFRYGLSKYSVKYLKDNLKSKKFWILSLLVGVCMRLKDNILNNKNRRNYDSC